MQFHGAGGNDKETGWVLRQLGAALVLPEVAALESFSTKIATVVARQCANCDSVPYEHVGQFGVAGRASQLLGDVAPGAASGAWHGGPGYDLKFSAWRPTQRQVQPLRVGK